MATSTRLAAFERRAAFARVIAGSAVMIGASFALKVLTRGHVPSPAEVWAAAGLSATATLVVAALYARDTPWPRGAYVFSAFLLAAATLLTAAYPVDPTHWARETHEIAWLFPWFFVSIHAGTSRKVGTCSVSAARWLLPLSAVLLGLSIHLPFLLDR